MGLTPGQFLWIGTHGQMEEELVPRADIHLATITGGPIVGVPRLTMLKNSLLLLRSLVTTNRLLANFNPDVLFLTGGYVNVPVTLVARLRRIPAVIYLPDIEPGRAITTLSRWVDKIACTSPASDQFLPADQLVPTGYPLRAQLRAATTLDRDQALAAFDLTPQRPTLFVFGGSRGARTINNALMAALPQLLQSIQIIHISGQLDWPTVQSHAETLPADQAAYYRPYPYLHERMAAAFRAADLVLARAGASMLGEGPAFGLPAILVPYPYAWRYQKVNADHLASKNAAIRLNDEDLTAKMSDLVLDLIHDQDRLQAMSTAAQALDTPEAATDIAHLLISLAHGGDHG